MAFVYRVIWAILLLLTFFDALMAYDGPKEAKIKVEILDSTYQFAGKGITFNTFDMRFFIRQPPNNRSSFGIFDPTNGNPIVRTFINPNQGNVDRLYFASAFQVNEDHSYTVMIMGGLGESKNTPYIGSYLWLDKDFTPKDTFNKFISPDFHGMLLSRDHQAFYNSRKYTYEDFSWIGGPDSARTETYNLHQYDPQTGKDRVIWDFLTTVDTRFIVPGNLYEGIPGSDFIDWSHPNSIYEDVDGDILYGTRHVGAGIISRNGEVLGWFGMPDSTIEQQGLPLLNNISGGDYILRRSHDFQQIRKGPFKGYYTLFDNGDLERDYSRVPVFEIDKQKNTIRLVKEYQFPFSPFMGSVDFLEDGTFLANVPYLPVAPRVMYDFSMEDKIDSISYYGKHSGSRLFWMNIEGDTLAKFTTNDLAYIYSARVVDIPEWPGIDCKFLPDGQLEMTPSGDKQVVISWYDGDDVIGNTSSIKVNPGKNYYYTFQHGMATGYSRKLDEKKCKH